MTIEKAEECICADCPARIRCEVGDLDCSDILSEYFLKGID